MKLRRIAVAGFKTFASRSQVDFDRGITAIVGPNGSGKSNLVDALRWALGETNARELRGQRMDEVVYAGGGRRNRVNVAEVELLIDNAEGRLPVEDAEVSVSRRVVRGAGDTEYRLNGDRVRLREVERILGSTGLTQNGYAVVAQNDIDGIIEATPGQRRALVEQAAGVRSLRAACEDATRRVGGAEAVLRRIADLLADAEPRLAELAVQAEAATAQRELGSRLAELRGSLAREEWRTARGRLKQARRRQEQALSRWEGAREAEAAFAERAREQRQRLEALRAERDSSREELEEALLAVERLTAAARRWRERARAALLRRRAARDEAAAAAADLDAAADAIARHAGAERSVSEDAASVLAEREHSIQLRARLAAACVEWEAQVESAAASLAAAVTERREAESALRDARSALDRAEAAAVALETEVQLADAAAAGRAAEAAAAGAAAESAAATAAAAERELKDAQAAGEAAWEAVNAAEERAAGASEAARLSLARAAEARGLLAGSLGGLGGVGRAVASGVLAGRRLADVVGPRDPADAAAIAAALEPFTAAWLVDDLDAAGVRLDPDGPRELVLDAHAAPGGEGDPPAPWRRACDAIDVDPAAEGAVRALLAGVWLGGGRHEAGRALAAGARMVVLRDGTTIEAARLRGGAPSPALAHAAEDRDATRAAQQAGAAEATAITALQAAREALGAAEAEAGRLAQAAQAARAAAVTAAAAAAGAAAEAASTQARLDVRREALQHGRAARDSAAAALSEAERRLTAAAEPVREAERVLAAAEAALGGGREELAGAETSAREAELAAARAEGAAAEAAVRAGELTAAAGAALRRREASAERMALAAAEAVEALAEGREARRRSEEASARLAEARARADGITPLLLQVERALLGLESEHAGVAVALARAEDERNAADQEVASAEEELSRLTDAAREEGDEEPADWDPQALERAEREIVRLERRIASLGPVNALAPEQHDTLLARVTALRDHRDDLESACGDIRHLARRLAADLERRFDAVFEAVTTQFSAIFAELFPEGRATLRLEEPSVADADEEVAEAVAERRPGVEILAQPPGKRLCPLRLLSGGERALTALGFVLALQQVNPSPFYVFDEVDAALDDSNVLRFTRLLRRLGADQQFIVVTHNHITMAAADVLWGITIDSDGVSSVIGVRFDAEAHEPTVAASGLRRVPAGSEA